MLSTANYLKNIITQDKCTAIVFGEHCSEVANVCIKDNRVVYLQRRNPVSKKYTIVTSPMLDSFQDLFVYLEQPSSNFEGLCDFMDNNWSARDCDCGFYTLFCNFLSDIKLDRTESIQQVLDGKKKCCYTELFESVFTPAINVRLYHDLHLLLKREDFNPLFMFVCQNFYMECEGQTSLTAYGRSIDGILLSAPPKPAKFISWVDDHKTSLRHDLASGIALLGASSISFWLALTILAYLYADYINMQAFWFIPLGLCLLMVAGIIFLLTSILSRVYNRYLYNCEQTFLKGGWRCFLQMEMPIRESKYNKLIYKEV